MRDAKNKELEVGDTVMIPAKVTDIPADGEVIVESVATDPVRDQKNLMGFHPKQIIRANDKDSTSFTTTVDNGKTLIHLER